MRTRTLIAIWVATVVLAGVGGSVFQSVGIAGLVAAALVLAAGAAASWRFR